MDYADAPDEVAKNPRAKEWIATVANGNADAADFLWRFWNFEHMLDDLVDHDKPVTPEQVMRETVLFIGTLAFNPFFLANKEQLFGLMAQAGNRWLDGDIWAASSDPKQRAEAPVLRSGDVDLAFHVALLTGGWDFMRSLREMRRHDPAEEQ